ncbi:MAG: peptidoglycan bridge formation glycyltransferase FemA/FemB family protein [Deltaproteobacteria bacterium]|nr:peptidoglycan bridge formation glycyltransferase FemA/FemB family protein [Deltaproteobacteria bacterium]
MGFEMRNMADRLTGLEYAQLDSRTVSGKKTSAWISKKKEDPLWDDFLLRTKGGGFEQSSLWAQVKEMDNWRPIRVVVDQDDLLVGGFQMLVRPTPFSGLFGYISKGPVVASEDHDVIRFVIDQLRATCREYRIFLLIAEPPDRAADCALHHEDDGVLPNNIVNLTGGTVVIDLKKDWSRIYGDMRKSTRKHLRQAGRRGITVREGSMDDLSSFFSLMLSTCERQGVHPNPDREEFFIRMWHLQDTATSQAPDGRV